MRLHIMLGPIAVGPLAGGGGDSLTMVEFENFRNVSRFYFLSPLCFKLGADESN